VEVTNEELENVALESTRTIEIDEFVQRDEIDPRYVIRPYHLRPDGKVGHDAFAVIRETIRDMNMVAIEDQYETALIDLINQKRAGKPIAPKERPHGENVVDLMEALRRSVGGAAAETKVPKKSAKKPLRAAKRKCSCRSPVRSRRKPPPRSSRPGRSESQLRVRAQWAIIAQCLLSPKRGRRNVNRFGLNFPATRRALLLQLSSAIFWASMTSPIGSSPTAPKHTPILGRPFSSISQTFDMAPG
jgi:Ku70/Ku80 beta-barrel domain